MKSKKQLLEYFNPRRAVLIFLALNFLFLIVDILLAHSYNRFKDAAEWIPVFYSAIAGCGLIIYVFLHKPSFYQRLLMHIILWAGVAVGFLGFVFHYQGATLRELSLKSLVYAAPLAAPLAYAGISLAALFTDGFGKKFGECRKRIILLLTAGGFAGNLLLSILDHARNGFFVPSEWIPVFVSAFATIVLFWAGVKSRLTKEDVITAHIAIIAAMVTGISGFIFHLAANLHGVMPTFIDRFTYGAPIFAPLLFCDIALLGLLAMFARSDFDCWYSERKEHLNL